VPEAADKIVRDLLTAIEDDAGVSQRKLSTEMGIAVGSVNWYLKRCINKGLVKLQQVPVKRYAYYLTPKGLDEKARLTASFLQSSLDLYRRGRAECGEFFRDCAADGKKLVFLAGDSDFAEIAVLSSLTTPTIAVAVVDPKSKQKECVGVPVYPRLAAAVKALGHPDAILLTHLTGPSDAYEWIVREMKNAGLDPEAIHIPSIIAFKPKGQD